jgi:hypothetical protein
LLGLSRDAALEDVVEEAFFMHDATSFVECGPESR